VLGMTRADQVHAFRWQPMGGGLSRDGRSGYSYGIAAVATSDGESRSDLIRLDRYIAFWRRQAPGPWRLVAYAEIGAPASPLTVDVGLVPPGQPVSGRTADLIGELRRTDLEFSDNASRAGIENAFASWAATDAVMFSGSEVVVGKDAIKELMRPTTSRSLAWRPVHAGVSGSGDLGFTVGEYVATGRSASGTVTQHFGKYLTVWRKEADGSWRFVVDGGNESPGQPAARSTGDR
jgi:ketosteroid isomerase-like protein